jgi:hypothetical protein
MRPAVALDDPGRMSLARRETRDAGPPTTARAVCGTILAKGRITLGTRLRNVWNGPVRPGAIATPIQIMPGREIRCRGGAFADPTGIEILLRYALEWQAWYENRPDLAWDDIDTIAFHCAVRWYGLLTESERDGAADPGPLCRAIVDAAARPHAVHALTEAEAKACRELREDDRGSARPRLADLTDLIALAAPVEAHLIADCDPRSTFNPATGRIGYRALPYPTRARLCFASSTSATLSEDAFRACADMRTALIAASRSAGREALSLDLARRIRRDITGLLAPGSGAQTILCASGTDAELLLIHIANAVLGTPLANILTAVDEIGRGARLAAQGRHFNDMTCRGLAVERGAPVEGLGHEIDYRPVAHRDEAGRAGNVDTDVQNALESAIRAGRKVLLHVVDRSKFGTRCPSLDLIDTIRARYGEHCIFAVDASQARISPQRMRWYLERNCVVYVTGSKFFSAPPFCGALLVPAGIAPRLRDHPLPSGLALYCRRGEWPDGWLPSDTVGNNPPALGLLFRWQAALHDMTHYFGLPVATRADILRRFGEAARQAMADCPAVEPLDCVPSSFDSDIALDEDFYERSMFAFFLMKDGRPLTPRESEVLYIALDRDATAALPDDAGEAERHIARTLCHVGQPVDLCHPSGAPSAILRVSAGIRLFPGSAPAGTAAPMTEELGMTFGKIKLLVDHLDRLPLIWRAAAAAQQARAARRGGD